MILYKAQRRECGSLQLLLGALAGGKEKLVAKLHGKCLCAQAAAEQGRIHADVCKLASSAAASVLSELVCRLHAGWIGGAAQGCDGRSARVVPRLRVWGFVCVPGDLRHLSLRSRFLRLMSAIPRSWMVG